MGGTDTQFEVVNSATGYIIPPLPFTKSKLSISLSSLTWNLLNILTDLKPSTRSPKDEDKLVVAGQSICSLSAFRHSNLPSLSLKRYCRRVPSRPVEYK
jgi:hypothetical protein